MKVDILEYLMDAFITVISFITRTSYIGTNIIMMVRPKKIHFQPSAVAGNISFHFSFLQTWSITYHSWFTFILLLGAIILWMVPNQRQSMLRVSPFLIAYAECLLTFQYGLGVNFIPSEVPKIRIPILNEDIVFVHEMYAFQPLAIQVSYTVDHSLSKVWFSLIRRVSLNICLCQLSQCTVKESNKMFICPILL